MATEKLPDGWRRVKFGEMVLHFTEKVKPQETDLKVYVGLEHLDPNSLRIKRHGTPDDVIGQKLRVKPRQIIFGKRRAYQRKLAVSHFDGICSAHAMILEANPDTVIPEFLPFFMQSDLFFDRALAISEGSLSPTIKWKTLAQQVFPIPPMERQRELVEVFSALEETIRCTEEAIESAEQLKGSLMAELLTRGIGHTRFKQTEIGEIPEAWEVTDLATVIEGKPANGYSPNTASTPPGIPTFSIAAVRHGSVDIDPYIKYARVSSAKAVGFQLQKDDILIIRGNANQELVGSCGLVTEFPAGCIFSDILIRVCANENILPALLVNMWNSSLVRKQILRKMKTTNGIYKVNQNDISTTRIALPPLSEQTRMMEILKPVVTEKPALEIKLNCLETARRGLMQDLLFY